MNQQFKPAATFNYPSRNSRNLTEPKKFLAGEGSREIMGNSWIKTIDGNKPKLANEAKKLPPVEILDELTEELADLEKQIEVETSKVHTNNQKTNIDSMEEFKADHHHLATPYDSKSEYGGSSFVGNHSLTSLAKTTKSKNKNLLSISSMSQIDSNK